MFKIKVCGITRAKDAKLAITLGADMIGLISFEKSPRYVSQSKMKSILDIVPPTIDKVLVSVGSHIESPIAMAHKMRFDYLQWHGPLTSRDVIDAHKLGLKIIAATSNPTLATINAAVKTGADIILLDNSSSDKVGGTGLRFDWNIKLTRDMNNLMLAGGINADNVEEGVDRFTPIVVDVNSGIETRPGIKSATKIKHFFNVCNVIRYGTT